MFTVSKQGHALSLVCAVALLLPAAAASQTAPPAVPEKPAAAALPPAQAIIDRHIEAIGGRAALKSHDSVHVKGTVSIPANGMTGAVEVFAARPNKVLTKMTLGGIGETAEGFDGTVAWSISPMTGPMLATGDELEQKALDANFDGALGIAAKYESIRTLEKTTFEDRPVYKLALTRKTGTEDIEFYDAETGLKAGTQVQRKSPMGMIAVTSAISDYRKFGDLLHATKVKQTVTGVQILLAFDSVEYDKVDPAVFDLPPPIKALVK